MNVLLLLVFEKIFWLLKQKCLESAQSQSKMLRFKHVNSNYYLNNKNATFTYAKG